MCVHSRSKMYSTFWGVYGSNPKNVTYNFGMSSFAISQLQKMYYQCLGQQNCAHSGSKRQEAPMFHFNPPLHMQPSANYRKCTMWVWSNKSAHTVGARGRKLPSYIFTLPLSRGQSVWWCLILSDEFWWLVSSFDQPWSAAGQYLQNKYLHISTMDITNHHTSSHKKLHYDHNIPQHFGISWMLLTFIYWNILNIIAYYWISIDMYWPTASHSLKPQLLKDSERNPEIPTEMEVSQKWGPMGAPKNGYYMLVYAYYSQYL